MYDKYKYPKKNRTIPRKIKERVKDWKKERWFEMLQSTRHLLSLNKRTQTIRPRPSRKKPTNDKSETIVLPPVLSLLKQLINIIIE